MILIYFFAGLVLGYILRATRRPSTRVSMTPETVLVLEDGTRVRWGDIPTDRKGRAAWLDEHCKCGKKHA